MNINNENIFTHRWLNLKEGSAENWVEQIHREDIGTCLDTYLTALREKRSFIMEYRLVSGESYRWILDHGTPWFLPDGSFAGYVGSCIDITPNCEPGIYQHSQSVLNRT